MNRRPPEYARQHTLNRRRLLEVGLAMGTAALGLPGASARATGSRRATQFRRPQFTDNPFTLGVASGDPLPDGIVLWTRLAPDPLHDGGMGSDPVEVRWELATDDGFKKIAQSGRETATADRAHSVHIEVAGLDPATTYYYRFHAGNDTSPTGRTKTAPAAHAPLDRLRWVTASCAHWEHGFFSAYRHLADEEVDFALFLGDYIYEYGDTNDYNTSQPPVRTFGSGETMTLSDYRNRHALYKTDANLQAAHAAMPWIVTWDDHEVDNDYAGDHSEDNEPVDQFLLRRAAAYQAYYEHMPLRATAMPAGPEALLYRRFAFGDLAAFSVLDTRQYRSPEPCASPGPHCDASDDPSVTLTGSEQERWLFAGLAASDARWNVVAQQVMMAQLDASPAPDKQLFNQDQWDGYPAARQRLLDFFQSARVSNPVVLSGDIHSAWANDLKRDFDDASSPTVGAEFVATSITSYNPYANVLSLALSFNPHLKFVDARHGYLRSEATAGALRTDYRALDTVATPDAAIATIAAFAVESGTPGVQTA